MMPPEGFSSASRPPDWTFESASPEATEALANRLARTLLGGEIILLRGPLGAGKTFFASALGAALGATEPLTSPSFVLWRTYPLKNDLTLHHLDFYRLEGPEDVLPLGVEEAAGPRNIVLVEWPERHPEAFAEPTLELDFVLTGESTRRIEGRWSLARGAGERWKPTEAIGPGQGDRP